MIKSIVYDKAKSLQSAAKAPILVTFTVQNVAEQKSDECNVENDQSFMTVLNVKDSVFPNKKSSLNMSDFSLIGGQKKSEKDHVSQPDKEYFEKALIFKTKDDLRQDNFCLQLIFLFKKMFSISQIPLFVKF